MSRFCEPDAGVIAGHRTNTAFMPDIVGGRRVYTLKQNGGTASIEQ
jgi:hypothetical protein